MRERASRDDTGEMIREARVVERNTKDKTEEALVAITLLLCQSTVYPPPKVLRNLYRRHV